MSRFVALGCNAASSAISPCDLCGKFPLWSSLSFLDRSTDEIRMIPDREASTPISFLYEKCSTLTRAPKINVQILLVDVKMVELATLVYSKHKRRGKEKHTPCIAVLNFTNV